MILSLFLMSGVAFADTPKDDDPQPAQTAKTKKPAKSKKAPIPPGFRTITPYLAINGAAAAIDWYKKAFNAKELARQAVPDGKLMHARIRRANWRREERSSRC